MYLIPSLVRSSGGRNGNPVQYYCLENPMDRGTWQATVHGVAKSRAKLNRISCVLAIWVSSLMKGLFSTFPIFFTIYIVYIFLIDFEKLFILYDCFLLVTDIVNISLEGLCFHYLLLNNLEKELSKCSYVKRLCVIKKSLVSQFNLYNLIYILPK